jgi:ribosome-associated protein
MIRITRNIAIDESEIEEEFVRASGPGGQNVNKVATAVVLRFDAAGSPSIPEDVLQRLKRLAGRRMTKDGVIVIRARRYRTQERNRKDAVDRLVKLIRRATERPRRRRPTKPTAAAREKRLRTKKRRSQTKRKRRRVTGSED